MAQSGFLFCLKAQMAGSGFVSCGSSVLGIISNISRRPTTSSFHSLDELIFIVRMEHVTVVEDIIVKCGWVDKVGAAIIQGGRCLNVRDHGSILI